MFGVACDHPPILIVMEYCPGGDLQTHLKKQQEAIEIGERLVYTLEVSVRNILPTSPSSSCKYEFGHLIAVEIIGCTGDAIPTQEELHTPRLGC